MPRRRAVDGQGGLADDQHVVSREIGARRRPAGTRTPSAFSSVPVSPFGSKSAILRVRLDGRVARRPRAGRRWSKRIVLGLARAEPDGRAQVVRARERARPAGRSVRGMRSCSPVGTETRSPRSRSSRSRAGRATTTQSQRHGLAGVVDDDELLLDRLARPEVVVLAREVAWLAADVGQQRPVVAEQGLRRRPSATQSDRSKARSMRS